MDIVATDKGTGTALPKWEFRDLFLVFLTIFCLITGLNILLTIFDANQFFDRSKYKSLITLCLFVVQEIIFIAPLYFHVIKKYKLNFAALGFLKIKVWEAVKWIFKAYGIVIIINIFLAIIIRQLGYFPPGFGLQDSHMPIFGSSGFDISIAVIVLVFIAPIAEEILFRGFLLPTLLMKFQPVLASLLSAALFALIHMEFESMGMMMILALVLNWLFLRSKSIWPCIIFHMINNALAFSLEILVWSGYLQV